MSYLTPTEATAVLGLRGRCEMGFFDRFRSLRELCRREYGDEFAEKYDNLNRGIPIGGMEETIVFLEKLDAVREKYGK